MINPLNVIHGQTPFDLGYKHEMLDRIKPRTRTIWPKQLVTCQRTINKDVLDAYMNGSRSDPRERPVVIKVGYIYVLKDGNHRATRALLRNERLTVDLYDVSKELADG